MAAPTSPILDTHTLDLDRPHALSSVERWTCTRCGCAVLVKGGHVYGSASAEECGNPAPVAAVPVDTSPAGTLRRAATKLRDTAGCNGYTVNCDSSGLLHMVALLLRARPLVADWLDGAAHDAEQIGPDPQAVAVARAVLGETEAPDGDAAPGRVVDNARSALDRLLSGEQR